MHYCNTLWSEKSKNKQFGVDNLLHSVVQPFNNNNPLNLFFNFHFIIFIFNHETNGDKAPLETVAKPALRL